MKLRHDPSWTAAALLLGVGANLAAQPAPAPLAFDVASVNPSGESSRGVAGSCHGIDSVYTPARKAEAPSPGRCVITDARLSHLVSIAWGIGSMQLIQSGADWIARGSERFDVVAKAEDPAKATEQQLLTMLQNVLVERFKMKYHRETTETSGFALLVDKNGAKLKESNSEDASIAVSRGPQDKASMIKPSPGQPNTVHLRRYSMAMLVNLLSGAGAYGAGVDKTGLTGVYDITLSWDDEGGPTLSTALRQQLGLRMESAKVPVSCFVIDSAQRPTAN